MSNDHCTTSGFFRDESMLRPSALTKAWALKLHASLISILVQSRMWGIIPDESMLQRLAPLERLSDNMCGMATVECMLVAFIIA